MSDPVKAENLSKEAQQARTAVEHGLNIREEVQSITLAALSRSQLDAQEMKRVVRSVLQGATLGLGKAGDKSRQMLDEALNGVDQALAQSAEASKLAIEEAAGRLRQFEKRDLERAFNDLQALESMFLETIKEVSEHSVVEARAILQDLLRHARDSGTAAGTTARAAIVSIEQKLGKSLREIVAAGTEASLAASSSLAEAAAGFLAAIASTLEVKAKSMRKEKR